MNSNTRLIVNTLAQNIRTVINIVLSLYSTRIAMQALGMSDYGIYMLVAGIVSLLSYLSSTLIVTTQRFLSYSAGAGQKEEMRKIFANSYLIHCLMGISLALLFASLTSVLFNGHLLNIPSEKMGEAKVVYLFVIVSVLFTFITAPFRALLISHENIVYISVVDVLDGMLKLGLVCSLLFVEHWRLPLYALIMAGVMFFNFIMQSSFCYWKYEECTLVPHIRQFDLSICRKLLNFATWTIYGMACVYTRTQGVSIILNRLLGTIANAAYGVVTQVYGSVLFLSQAIQNAFSPQIIKAEGSGDRQRMLHLAELSSKYAFLLLAMVVIPLSFEIPAVLSWWLGCVPPHAVVLCRFILLTSLCDQITIGLGTANQAIGRIRNYSLVVNTIKVLTLPFFWFCLHAGYGLEKAMWVYIGFEAVCALVRLFFLQHTAGLSIRHFVEHVFARVTIPLLSVTAACWLMVSYVDIPFRFLITGFLSAIVSVVAVWLSGLESGERQWVLTTIKKTTSCTHFL